MLSALWLQIRKLFGYKSFEDKLEERWKDLMSLSISDCRVVWSEELAYLYMGQIATSRYRQMRHFVTDKGIEYIICNHPMDTKNEDTKIMLYADVLIPRLVDQHPDDYGPLTWSRQQRADKHVTEVFDLASLKNALKNRLYELDTMKIDPGVREQYREHYKERLADLVREYE